MTQPDGPRYADPDDVAEQVNKWDDKILECRTYGHTWRPSRATHNKRYHYFLAVQQCPRCTTERHMEISERGAVYSSWYVYPDGYLSEGLGRITGEARDVLRLSAITRTFPVEVLGPKAAREDQPHSMHTRAAIGWTA